MTNSHGENLDMKSMAAGASPF